MATVLITTLPTKGGTVTPPTGLQTVGSTIDLIALAELGYDFVNFVTGGVVTTNPKLTIVVPNNDTVYNANFSLHNLNIVDYQNISNYLSRFYVASGITGNSPNASLAAKLLPNALCILNELNQFNLAKSLGLNTAVHYVNIYNILNNNTVVIPIV